MEFGERVNTRVMATSGDDQGEPQRPDLLQSPHPASGSWREKAHDAGVFHEDGGLVCPDKSCESQW